MGYLKRLVLMAMIGGLLAASAIGCGGSSEAAPLKKAQFVKQADAVCAKAQSEREAQSQELSQQERSELESKDPEEVMQQLLEPVDQMTEELSDLGPPKGQEKQAEAIIQAYEAAAAQLEADPTGGNPVSAFAKANKLAENFGLTGCAI